MGKESITIDLNTKIPAEDLPYLEEKANEAIWKNVPVGIRYPSKEELAKLEYRSKKELEGQVRIVNVGEYDCCACCGTHVKLAGEIGQIKIIRAAHAWNCFAASVHCRSSVRKTTFPQRLAGCFLCLRLRQTAQ